MRPSILKIKSVFTSKRPFDFSIVSSDAVSKTIISLDSTKKASGINPKKNFKKQRDKEICRDLANCINESIKRNEFPNKLKARDITPIFKKRIH